MTDTLEAARRSYAEELRFLTHMGSLALFDAFAKVPRERFVGPGPWRTLDLNGFWTTESSDPREAYHNTLISLDAAKGINNGQPSLWALCFDQIDVRSGDHVLHLGCGTGYYTAILAELVGPEGRVTAVEIDEAMAERACKALGPWPQAAVIQGDGSRGRFQPADVIVVSAGATHPLQPWLGAIKPGGRLLFPLTPDKGSGAMTYLTRKSEATFSVQLIYGALFMPFSGARDAEASSRLADALKRDKGVRVKSLRSDVHKEDETCWLHGEGWCFSTRPAVQADTVA